MTETDEGGLLHRVITSLVWGIAGFGVYLLYRFLRPYWYAMRIRNWLLEERDYVKDFSRSLHPFGFYEFEVHLKEEGDPEIIIENTSRRVPVIIRAERDFRSDVMSNLVRRTDEDQAHYAREEFRQFLELIEWALNTAPGVSWYVDHEGELCSAEDADGVVVEYRIYPDAVSQHEIINSVVEIGSAFKMIRQREEKYADRLQDHQ